jgi:hypothetical protein
MRQRQQAAPWAVLLLASSLALAEAVTVAAAAAAAAARKAAVCHQQSRPRQGLHRQGAHSIRQGVLLAQQVSKGQLLAGLVLQLLLLLLLLQSL